MSWAKCVDWIKQQAQSGAKIYNCYEAGTVRLDAEVAELTGRVVRLAPTGCLPKGLGALTAAILHTEVIDWKLDRGQWTHGAHLLRTNCTEKDPRQPWQW